MIFGAAALFAGATTGTAPASAEEKTCYAIGGHASYRGLGYKHIVTVKNNCGGAINCRVWTNVDPTPKHSLTITNGGSKSVVTRIGSPASAFTAQGTCTPQSK